VQALRIKVSVSRNCPGALNPSMSPVEMPSLAEFLHNAVVKRRFASGNMPEEGSPGQKKQKVTSREPVLLVPGMQTGVPIVPIHSPSPADHDCRLTSENHVMQQSSQKRGSSIMSPSDPMIGDKWAGISRPQMAGISYAGLLFPFLCNSCPRMAGPDEAFSHEAGRAEAVVWHLIKKGLHVRSEQLANAQQRSRKPQHERLTASVDKVADDCTLPQAEAQHRADCEDQKEGGFASATSLPGSASL
jgi:hypothetical protein